MSEIADILRRWPGQVARHPGIGSARDKLVALVIGTEMDWRSGTFPLHVNRIAKVAGVEPGHVRGALRTLERLGLLEDTGTTDQRGRWVYRFRIPERVTA